MDDLIQWEPIVPAPLDASQPKFRHIKMGDPIAIYEYKNEEGQLWCYICRYINSDGKKILLPRTFGYWKGRLTWAFKGGPAPKPLYGANLFRIFKDAEVMVVEGEKAADKARELFPNLIVVCSMNGSRSPQKSDWSLVKNRSVTIWRDNDPEGQKYERAVVRLCEAAGAKQIRSVAIPDFLPFKWDLGDDFPEGFSLEDANRLIADSPCCTSIQTIAEFADDEVVKFVKYPFRLTQTHVQYAIEIKDGGEEWIDLCTRLEVIAITRDHVSKDWGRLLRFADLDGYVHEWALPMRMLAGDGSAYREQLLDSGLIFDSNPGVHKALHKYLATTKPEKRFLSVSRVGWHSGNSVFVLPNKKFGSTQVVFQSEIVPEDSFGNSGELSDWQEQIGRYAVGNSRLVLGICTAFAACLLGPTESENGGIHLDGDSSIGKTTVLRVAGSIWGGGGVRGYLRQWRATCNGLEGVAASHCDTLLCLDEIGQAPPDQVGDVAYMLANGTGKSRADRRGNARKASEWRLLYLSSGEKSLAERVAEYSKTTTAGQEVRIIDVPADPGAGHGLFENIHGFSNGDAFACHLKTATEKYYGTPIRHFLALLTANHDVIGNVSLEVKEGLSTFYETLGLSHANGQVKRVARRFALLAASGELATRLGILPWKQGDASDGIRNCFNSWLIQRGGVEAHEVSVILRQIKLFFEQHGESRFSCVDKTEGDSRPTYDRAGFKKSGPEGTEFFVLPEVFNTELCKGLKPKQVAKILIERGHLKKGDNGRSQVNKRLPGTQKTTRCYHFTSKILEGLESELNNDDLKLPYCQGKNGNEGNQPISQQLHDGAGVPSNIPTEGTGNTSDPSCPSDPKVEANINLKEIGNVPQDAHVPSSKANLEEFALTSFKRLVEIAKTDGADFAPLMDDLSARSINHLGGWPIFCEKSSKQGAEDLQEEFVAIFRKLIPDKLKGFYDRDPLPRVEGLYGSQGVYRL